MDRDLATLLRKARTDVGLTQEGLAERAAVSTRTISDIERGLRTSIYKDTSERLASALGLMDVERAAFFSIARGRTEVGSKAGISDGVPAPASTLVGRRGELERLLSHLQDPGVRLVTLTGPGGIGKTRLATEAAILARPGFPDGVIFVSLASIQDVTLFAPAVRRALGVKAIDGHPLHAVIAQLRSARALLVLDTLEHVIDAGEEIAQLIAACPSLCVLATSREALRLQAEVEFPLPPLDVPVSGEDDLDRFGATALFVQRARAAFSDLDIALGSAPLVIDICARLEGVPLAIELAAARMKHLTLPSLLEHLDRSLDVLTGGPRDLPARQRTMRDTVAWSYALLDEDERAMLRTLSMFDGGCSLEAARELWTHDDVLSGISALIDKNLLRAPDARSEESRYRMFDVIREFAAEQRDMLGETPSLSERHAEYFLGFAERAEPELGRARQEDWMQRLDLDRDNIRSALRWAIDAGRPDVAQRIAGATWHYWRARGDIAEGRAWLQRVLDLDDDPDRPTRAKAYWGAAWLAFHGGAYEEAGTLSVEFLALARRGGTPRDTRNALTVRGMVAMVEGRYAEALVSFEECVVLCRSLGRNWLLASSFLNLGVGLLNSGEPLAAQSRLEEALGLYEELGDRHFIARTHAYIGLTRALEGDQAGARASAAEALRCFRELDDQPGTAEALEALAVIDSVRDPLLAAFEAGAAQRLRDSIAQKRFPFDARLVTERLESARGSVDAHDWEEAWRQGLEADLSSAIERVL